MSDNGQDALKQRDGISFGGRFSTHTLVSLLGLAIGGGGGFVLSGHTQGINQVVNQESFQTLNTNIAVISSKVERLEKDMQTALRLLERRQAQGGD